ncbi:MAG: LLM class F420-dependent oxidoreductase [Chromatiales bacterium]|jgi:probable F420-dependent oxidoreductase|nr:LLM class F420-dependent oxidoreductase [Chromatiales bacterium]
MKIGVNLINFGPSATPENLTRWVQVVEGLGYHSLLTSDHVVTTPDVQSRYPAPFYEPLSTLGWLAAATTSLMIGTTVIIVPYRHPLEVARAIANVDQLSGGRCILGVGVGWAKQEFQALGIPFNQRGAMTDEYLEAIKVAWTQDVASFAGRYVSFENVHTAPRPRQMPGPPIWVGGASEAAMLRTIRLADAWHPIRIKTPYFADQQVPELRRLADTQGRPMPALCPRLRFEITTSPIRSDERFMGHGSIDQVRADLTELEALGCEHVLLDSFHDDVAATTRPEAAWSMLAQVANSAFDLARETVL